MIKPPPITEPVEAFLHAALEGDNQGEVNVFYDNFAANIMVMQAVRVAHGESLEPAVVQDNCEKLLMQHALARRNLNPGSAFINQAYALGWRYLTRRPGPTFGPKP